MSSPCLRIWQNTCVWQDQVTGERSPDSVPGLPTYRRWGRDRRGHSFRRDTQWGRKIETANDVERLRELVSHLCFTACQLRWWGDCEDSLPQINIICIINITKGCTFNRPVNIICVWEAAMLGGVGWTVHVVMAAARLGDEGHCTVNNCDISTCGCGSSQTEIWDKDSTVHNSVTYLWLWQQPGRDIQVNVQYSTVHISAVPIAQISNDRLLRVPRWKLKSFGYRSFSYQGPVVWNSLPTDQTWDFSANRRISADWEAPRVIFEISSNPLRKL